MKTRSQHSRPYVAGVLVFFMGLCGHPVLAQLPPSPFEETDAEAAQPAVDTPKSEDGKPAVPKNMYLDTFMTLQRQNTLLAQLLEREKSVADMVASYKKMGVTYDAPKPDLQTCLALPKNLSCAMAYPDRYPDFLPPPPPLPLVPVTPVTVSTDELPQAIARLSPDSGLKNLMWTDITCLQGSCRAVITPDPSDPSARYSIKAGDTLPPGGTVERISDSGITILDGKTVIQVPPAPIRPFAM